MKIKDCLACKLNEQPIIEFLADCILYDLESKESIESLDWGPECSKGNVKHLVSDHWEEVKKIQKEMHRQVLKIAKEVF